MSSPGLEMILHAFFTFIVFIILKFLFYVESIVVIRSFFVFVIHYYVVKQLSMQNGSCTKIPGVRLTLQDYEGSSDFIN